MRSSNVMPALSLRNSNVMHALLVGIGISRLAGV